MTEKPTRRGELAAAAGEQGWAIFDPDSDAVHYLNDTARAIWELCDGETTADEIAGAIADLTAIDQPQAMNDVTETIYRLRRLKLLEG